MKTLHTECCIAGGGPAGIMLGYLLARAGVEVVVLEKWPDFFRDFRGDTIHPSTMEVLHELGLLKEFLALPHNETEQMRAHIGSEVVTIADLTRLNVRTPFIAFIPQWDFLQFLSAKARAFPTFTLMMEAEATDVLEENGTIVGVRAKTKDGEVEIRASLTVAADGRHSVLREKAKLEIQNLGAPIDVLWFRVPRKDDGTKQSLGYINQGKIMVLLDRDSYWQCGFIITKGEFEHIKALGLNAFKQSIVALNPTLTTAVDELTSWEQIKLLSVTVDHLVEWYKEGLLCVGDSAHAMSPVGGIGINLAIQDAVAAANVLAPAFAIGMPSTKDLAKIQKRRQRATLLTQHLQIFLHKRVLWPALANKGETKIPWQLQVVQALPFLQWIPARLIGIGFKPEHVKIDFKESMK